MTTRYAAWPCPYCGHVVDSASHPRETQAVPQPGDLLVCIYCAEPQILDDGGCRKLSDDELLALSVEEKRSLSLVQHAIRGINKEKAP